MKDTLLSGKAYPLNDHYELTLLLPSDINDIVTMLNDELVTRFLYFAPAPDSVFRDYFTPMAEQNEAALKGEGEPSMVLITRSRSSGAFAGMSALTPVMMVNGVYEVGYQIPSAYWGLGLASAISHLLLKYGFESLHAHKITADCYGTNIGSERVMQKLGMVKEGHQADYYSTEDGLCDRLLYGITREQYLNL